MRSFGTKLATKSGFKKTFRSFLCNFNRNEAVEELVSVTKLYNSGCLYLGGTRISANHYNTVLTHARKSWLKRGLNNEKLATQSDLIAAGYTLTNNQNTSDVESSKMAAYPLQTPS